jgi:hypothetical protein
MTHSQASERYQARQYKAKRCITCAEKNERWPKQKCSWCAKKQSNYYQTIGKFKRLRPSVRLMKFMAARIKQLEKELRNANNPRI